MSRPRSLTEMKLPARMTSPVRSAKKRSTKLSQEDEVGGKCILKRGRFAAAALPKASAVTKPMPPPPPVATPLAQIGKPLVGVKRLRAAAAISDGSVI